MRTSGGGPSFDSITQFIPTHDLSPYWRCKGGLPTFTFCAWAYACAKPFFLYALCTQKHVARLRRLHHKETPQSRGSSTVAATASATAAETSPPVKVSRENTGNVGGRPPSNTLGTVSTLAPAAASTWTQPGTERNVNLVDAAAAAAAPAAADATGGAGETSFLGGERLSHSPSGGLQVSPSPLPDTQPLTSRNSREGKMAISAKAPPVASNNARVSTNVGGKPEPGESRSGDIAYRRVESVISKLCEIGRDLEAEQEWIDDPKGGAVEFRAMVFVKRLERLAVQCEEAHVEAEAVAEAFLLRDEQKAGVVR